MSTPVNPQELRRAAGAATPGGSLAFPTCCQASQSARAVPTSWLCRNTMISRTIFCSAQGAVIRLARTHGADAIDLAQAVRLCLDHIEYPFAKHPNSFLA